MRRKHTQTDHDKTNFASLFKKIAFGAFLILFVGFVAYALLFVLMFII